MKIRKNELNKIQKLVMIRKNESLLAQSAVVEARNSEDRAEAVHSRSLSVRDRAFVDWEKSFHSSDMDIGLCNIRAQQLVKCETQADRSEDLLNLAKTRLAEKQSHWKKSDLNLKIMERIERKASRRIDRKTDEQRLEEVSDRFCLRSVKYGQ